MRRFGIFVCGVLLSVQGFAGKGGTGNAGRAIKNFLASPQAAKVAALNGETSAAINSRNLGQKILTAAMGLAMLVGVGTATIDASDKLATKGAAKAASGEAV